MECVPKNTFDEQLIGKDANCFVQKWLTSNVIEPFNCTLPYLAGLIDGIPPDLAVCPPRVIARAYQETIQLVHSGSMHSQEVLGRYTFMCFFTSIYYTLF